MDDEGEDISRRRRLGMAKSESFFKSRSTSSCATPRYQWRSISWSNHTPVGVSEEDEGGGASSEQQQDSYEGDLCPPLESLSVSKPATDGRATKKGRCLEIKLDLGVIEKGVPEEDADSEMQAQQQQQQQSEDMGVEKDKNCSQISSYLYVAGRSVAQNYAILQSYRITHILNCVGLCCPEYYPNEFHYKTLWLHDNPSEDIICVLYDVFDFLENVREQAGCQVLLHCSEGVSRSMALVIAYLMWRDRQTYEQVFERVKSIRPSTNPNLGFVFQLMHWQSRILDPTSKDSVHMYRICPQSAYDPRYLVPKSVSTPTLDALDSRFSFVIQAAGRLYVWKGRSCDKSMVAAADKVAFQLIRYERAHGPIVKISEGNEPEQLLEVLSPAACVGAGGDPDSRCQASAANSDRTISSYDTDYELYVQAEPRTPSPSPAKNLRSHAAATTSGNGSPSVKRLAK